MWSLQIQHEEPLPNEWQDGVGVVQRGCKLRPPIDAEVGGGESPWQTQLSESTLEKEIVY